MCYYGWFDMWLLFFGMLAGCQLCFFLYFDIVICSRCNSTRTRSLFIFIYRRSLTGIRFQADEHFMKQCECERECLELICRQAVATIIIDFDNNNTNKRKQTERHFGLLKAFSSDRRKQINTHSQ